MRLTLLAIALLVSIVHLNAQDIGDGQDARRIGAPSPAAKEQGGVQSDRIEMVVRQPASSPIW